MISPVGWSQHAAIAAAINQSQPDDPVSVRSVRRILSKPKPLRQWGAVLHDNDLAEALLDRTLENGRHVPIGGTS